MMRHAGHHDPRLPSHVRSLSDRTAPLNKWLLSLFIPSLFPSLFPLYSELERRLAYADTEITFSYRFGANAVSNQPVLIHTRYLDTGEGARALSPVLLKHRSNNLCCLMTTQAADPHVSRALLTHLVLATYGKIEREYRASLHECW